MSVWTNKLSATELVQVFEDTIIDLARPIPRLESRIRLDELRKELSKRMRGHTAEWPDDFRVGDVWQDQLEPEIAIFHGSGFICIGEIEPGVRGISLSPTINFTPEHGHWRRIGNVRPMKLASVIVDEAIAECSEQKQ